MLFASCGLHTGLSAKIRFSEHKAVLESVKKKAWQGFLRQKIVLTHHIALYTFTLEAQSLCHKVNLLDAKATSSFTIGLCYFLSEDFSHVAEVIGHVAEALGQRLRQSRRFNRVLGPELPTFEKGAYQQKIDRHTHGKHRDRCQSFADTYPYEKTQAEHLQEVVHAVR